MGIKSVGRAPVSQQEDYQAGAVLAKRLMRLGERERGTVSAVVQPHEVLLQPTHMGRLPQFCDLCRQVHCKDGPPWSPRCAPVDKAKTLFSVTAFKALLLINLD